MLQGHNRTAERLLFLRKSTEAKEILARVKAVRFVGFALEEEPTRTPSEIWRHISPLAAQPTSKLAMHVPENFAWLEDYTGLLNLDSICYVSLGGYDLPWIKLEIVQPHWPQSLANEIDTLDLIIMHPESRNYVAITEEEYDYYVFVRVGDT